MHLKGSVCGGQLRLTKRMFAACGFSARTLLRFNAINTKGTAISMSNRICWVSDLKRAVVFENGPEREDYRSMKFTTCLP